MARKQLKKPTAPVSSRHRRHVRKFLGMVLTLAAAAGLVYGLKRLGDRAQRTIAPRDRYTGRFADIDCDPPPGSTRDAFLAEVRFHSQFPETFQSLDPEITSKLTAVFAAHPWVESVASVQIGPRSAVRVNLKYRAPALAVRVAGRDGTVRVVDAGGVLLPITADAVGLPELITAVPAPSMPSGKKWMDATVSRAVELLEAHRPSRLAKTLLGWRLTLADGRTVLVGR